MGNFLLCAFLCFLWQSSHNDPHVRNVARSMNMLACRLRDKTEWLGKRQSSMIVARTTMPLVHRQCDKTVSFVEDRPSKGCAVPLFLGHRWLGMIRVRRRVHSSSRLPHQRQNQGMHGSGNTRVQNGESTPRPVIPVVELNRCAAA